MLFSAPSFFIFFFFYLILFQLFSASFEVALTILGGSVFYAYWKLPYLAVPYGLLALTIVCTDWCARAATPKAKKLRLTGSVTLILLPLIFFKYANFIYENLALLTGHPSSRLVNLPLPLGISFVTFTLLAYLIDICRAKKHSGSRTSLVAACVLFFPHLIAGPIVRPVRLISQFARKRNWRVRYLPAFTLFTVGLAKKLILADQIAPYVDHVYAGHGSFGAVDHWLAIYGFALQIYCDFSGYTDMALGLALFLRIRLPKNFRRPYLAVSLVDFWRRWHITLSLWLRDYLYIPLGGNRGGQLKKSRNLLITMVLGGLWHGASWTFLFWGLIHGLGLVVVHTLRRIPGLSALTRLPRLLSVFLTFQIVVVAWVFFRAPTLRGAFSMMAGAFHGPWDFSAAHAFPLAILLTGFLVHPWDHPVIVRRAAEELPRPVLWVGLVFLWIASIAISAGHSAEFIYFDF